MAEPWINPHLTANHIQDSPTTTPATVVSPAALPLPPTTPPPPLIALALISTRGGRRWRDEERGEAWLIRRQDVPKRKLRAFCDIYIGRGGGGRMLRRGRFVDTRGDGREIHRARRVHFSRFHRFRFIINDPRHRGSRRVAVDAFTAREIDHSCSALGPFVRHCSMMSPVYAWEGGREREGVG